MKTHWKIVVKLTYVTDLQRQDFALCLYSTQHKNGPAAISTLEVFMLKLTCYALILHFLQSPSPHERQYYDGNAKINFDFY